MKRASKVLAVTIMLFCCDALTGKEVARLRINQVSSENNVVVEEAILDLRRDDEIAIWSDIDVWYEGDVDLRFKIRIEKDGRETDRFEFDPMKKISR